MLLEILQWIENANKFISFQVCVRSIYVQGQEVVFAHRSGDLPDKHAIWFDREEFCDDSSYNKDRVPRWRPISATSRQGWNRLCPIDYVSLCIVMTNSCKRVEITNGQLSYTYCQDLFSNNLDVSETSYPGYETFFTRRGTIESLTFRCSSFPILNFFQQSP